MNSSTQKNCTIDNMNAFERGVKRAFDCIGALLGLICLSPVFLVISCNDGVPAECHSRPQEGLFTVMPLFYLIPY